MTVEFGRAVNDPEKAVLPAIIWATKRDAAASAHALSIGWWDFYVAVLWGRRIVREDAA